MNVCFRRLDMVVEIVTESLNVRDVFCAAVVLEVSREQDFHAVSFVV